MSAPAVKKTSTVAKASHPSFKEMILNAVVALCGGRQKASRQMIQKYIFANNLTVEDNASNRTHIKKALARLAESGEVTRKSGTGASGSFRPGKVEKKPKVVKKVAAKPKKAVEKKSPPKKSSAKKSPVKKSPAKAKKTATKPKKVTAAKKSPAKKVAAKKTAVKKTVAKKPASKKTVSKKVAPKKTSK